MGQWFLSPVRLPVPPPRHREWRLSYQRLSPAVVRPCLQHLSFVDVTVFTSGSVRSFERSPLPTSAQDRGGSGTHAPRACRIRRAGGPRRTRPGRLHTTSRRHTTAASNRVSSAVL